MRKIVGRLIVVVLALTISTPTAAQAVDPAPPNALGLSAAQNGPWTANLTDPLFSATNLWVPGDTDTAGFWARNQSTDLTEFRIVVVPQIEDLATTGDLDLQIRADGGAWVPLSTSWSTPSSLAPGEKTHIEIRAELLASSTNVSQELEFSFNIRARLTYTGPDTDPTPTPSPSPSASPSPSQAPGDDGVRDRDDDKNDNDAPSSADGNLSGTGATYPTWLLPVGFGALATGLWLAIMARRRQDEAEESELS